ncbi:MAG: hypothetical protein V1770_02250 [bacterium]
MTNGIYYNRMGESGTSHVWREPKEGESILLSKKYFLQYFPDTKIQGEINWQCDGEDGSSSNCQNCDRCGKTVELTFGEKDNFTASYAEKYAEPIHRIEKFKWKWSGAGVTEHWFDSEAVCLKVLGSYSSDSRLTADYSCVVAYKWHKKVASFRNYCSDDSPTFGGDVIAAEFVNKATEYGANWTGFAISENFIGDNLHKIIAMELEEEKSAIEPTVCRHNRQISARIITADSKKIPYYLCFNCRIKGIKLVEFLQRNQRDVCPYFRRACKSVTEKSDSLPDWFKWQGDNLISSFLRMEDGEYLAYEVTYIRRKDGFVRRSVLLLNSQTREAWLYKYNGFIPRKYGEFVKEDKYPKGYQILGYLGTEYNRDDGFLSREKVKAVILEGFEKPVLSGKQESVADFNYQHESLLPFGICRGIVNGLEIDSFSDGKKSADEPFTKNPTPILSENGWNYYLLIVWGYKKIVTIRKKSQEILRLDYGDGNGLYVLRVISK